MDPKISPEWYLTAEDATNLDNDLLSKNNDES
jgi:hypothetical protein